MVIAMRLIFDFAHKALFIYMIYGDNYYISIFETVSLEDYDGQWQSLTYNPDGSSQLYSLHIGLINGKGVDKRSFCLRISSLNRLLVKNYEYFTLY